MQEDEAANRRRSGWQQTLAKWAPHCGGWWGGVVGKRFGNQSDDLMPTNSLCPLSTAHLEMKLKLLSLLALLVAFAFAGWLLLLLLLVGCCYLAGGSNISSVCLSSAKACFVHFRLPMPQDQKTPSSIHCHLVLPIAPPARSIWLKCFRLVSFLLRDCYSCFSICFTYI